jgi:hypothetical protein
VQNNRVRVGSVYVYHPNMLDRIDGRTGLKSGDHVRVVNMHGCPPANTMGHCHVEEPATGRFIGLVHVNSLHTLKEYIEYLRAEIKKRELEQELARNACRAADAIYGEDHV